MVIFFFPNIIASLASASGDIKRAGKAGFILPPFLSYKDS
jgi:hypothetical protein